MSRTAWPTCPACSPAVVERWSTWSLTWSWTRSCTADAACRALSATFSPGRPAGSSVQLLVSLNGIPPVQIGGPLLCTNSFPEVSDIRNSRNSAITNGLAPRLEAVRVTEGGCHRLHGRLDQRDRRQVARRRLRVLQAARR